MHIGNDGNADTNSKATRASRHYADAAGNSDPHGRDWDGGTLKIASRSDRLPHVSEQVQILPSAFDVGLPVPRVAPAGGLETVGRLELVPACESRLHLPMVAAGMTLTR